MKKPTLKTCRRTVQIFIALAFIIIPMLNRSRYSYMYGNFLSFHMFGIPFNDPLAILQLSVKNLYLTLNNIIGTFLPLMIAYFLGTVFCSWLCPFGLFSELTQKIRKILLPNRQNFLAISHKGFRFKMIVFLLGFGGFFIFSTTPVLNQLSLPAWYARFFQYYFGQDFVSLCFLFLLAILSIEFIAGKRLWCRYICPQSILIILTKILNQNRLKVAFVKDNCICKPGYDKCGAACSLNLQPKLLDNRIELECSNCGDCIVACNKMGKALFFRSPLPTWLPSLTKTKKFLPGLKPVVITILLLSAITFAGITTFTVLNNRKTTTVDQTKTNSLLANKILSWKNGSADYLELLKNGTLICIGREWPINGYKGGHWESSDQNGSLKLFFNSADPLSFTQITPKDTFGKNREFLLNQFEKGKIVEAVSRPLVFTRYEPLKRSHLATATNLNATALLNRYAEEVYVLDLRVQDPHGVIKKILSEGDAITNEVMLTNVKYWMNTPDIIVSEGKAPLLPIKSSLQILFHDGHKETAIFQTRHIFDRSDEVLDDPWF